LSFCAVVEFVQVDMKNAASIYFLLRQRFFINTNNIKKIQHSFRKKEAGHKYIFPKV